MSNVVAAKRTESSVQFVQTARDLVLKSISRYNRISKRSKDFMLEGFINPLLRVYQDVMFIRRLYTKDDTNSLLRIKLCQKVLGKLDYLASMLDIFYDQEQSSLEITPNQWSEWIRLINKETFLINGLRKKELESIRKRHFNPLDLENEEDRIRWQKIEEELGISMFEEGLNEELNKDMGLR